MIYLSLFVIWFFCISKRQLSEADQYQVRVLAHSVGAAQLPLISWYLRYPRFIHAEMMTHKDFSRSAASSRAIPVKRVLAQVWKHPAIPMYWGKNQPGMQASTEINPVIRFFLRNVWINTGRLMCVVVGILHLCKLHKQTANRLLEPWQWMEVTLTTCKTKNFFGLRDHPDAQPEIAHLARLMKSSLQDSQPIVLKLGEWHLPWVTEQDSLETMKKRSAARCARSSYGLFGNSTVERDLATYEKLVGSTPKHASPCEHQATPDTQKTIIVFENNRISKKLVWEHPELHGNLTGYIQHRRQIPEHYIDD